MHRMINHHPKFVSETEDHVLTFQQCKVLMLISQLLTWRVMETEREAVRAKKIELMKEDGCKSMKNLV